MLVRPVLSAPMRAGRPMLDMAAAQPGVPDQCFEAVLDQMDTGAVICDAHGRVLWLNEAARRELDDGGVLRLEADGRLAIDSAPDAQVLRRAVQNAALAGLRQLVPLRVAQRALMVAVQPLATATPTQAAAVLLLGRRQLAPGLAIEMLASLHALTYAERRVLKGLLDGLRVTALARVHGVAVSTVRTQVATLRAKFGVRRVDDLVRLVAELPPVAGVLRGVRQRADDRASVRLGDAPPAMATNRPLTSAANSGLAGETMTG